MKQALCAGLLLAGLAACRPPATPPALQAGPPETIQTTSAPTSQAAGPAASAPATSRPASAPAASAPALPPITIVDKFIPFDEEREKLTLAYIQKHYDPSATEISITPKMVIIHWTGGNSFKGTFATFSNTRIEAGRKSVKKAGDLNVSSQFVIDRDGTIYRLMPETKMARHCIGLNRVAIGVENIGGPDNPLTEAQRKANVALVRYLAAKYPEIQYLIGHLEYRAFDGTPLFQELDPKYRNAKPDPGPEFMALLRKDLHDLGLLGPPTK